MSPIIAYSLTIVALFICAYSYIFIAKKYNIEDVPNERSSHIVKTIRGGGILFVISILIYFFSHSLPLPYLFSAIFLVAVISFIDDIFTLGTSIRMLVQLLSIVLLFYQLELLDTSIFVLIPLLIFCIGFTNIYNFMDGINGITGFYSLVILISLLVLNHFNPLIDNEILIYGILGIAVFGFFNFRKRALFFAGDIGSISIGVFVIYFLLFFSIHLKSVVPLMFVSVYLIDGGLTIVQRLLKKENIFKPHRSHLYQKLSNSNTLSHLQVSGSYALVQISINIFMIYILLHHTTMQHIFMLILLLICIFVHLFIQQKLKTKQATS